MIKGFSFLSDLDFSIYKHYVFVPLWYALNKLAKSRLSEVIQIFWVCLMQEKSVENPSVCTTIKQVAVWNVGSSRVSMGPQ